MSRVIYCRITTSGGLGATAGVGIDQSFMDVEALSKWLLPGVKYAFISQLHESLRDIGVVWEEFVADEFVKHFIDWLNAGAPGHE